MDKLNLEIVKEGYANGAAEGRPLTEEEKSRMIEHASIAFGNFFNGIKS